MGGKQVKTLAQLLLSAAVVLPTVYAAKYGAGLYVYLRNNGFVLPDSGSEGAAHFLPTSYGVVGRAELFAVLSLLSPVSLQVVARTLALIPALRRLLYDKEDKRPAKKK